MTVNILRFFSGIRHHTSIIKQTKRQISRPLRLFATRQPHWIICTSLQLRDLSSRGHLCLCVPCDTLCKMCKIRTRVRVKVRSPCSSCQRPRGCRYWSVHLESPLTRYSKSRPCARAVCFNECSFEQLQTAAANPSKRANLTVLSPVLFSSRVSLAKRRTGPRWSVC